MTERPDPPRGAVVLAGGGSRRFGGVDKTALPVGGVAVLDRVLTALAAAEVAEIVVVADPRPVCVPVRFVREEPAGAGPVAALGAGLAALRAARTYLLAGDLPFVDAAALHALARGAGDLDGAVALDDGGRVQPLLSFWRTASLRAALAAAPAERRLTALVATRAAARVPLPGHPPRWWDCDEETAWRQAEEWAMNDGNDPGGADREADERGRLTLDGWLERVRAEFGLDAVDRDLVLDLARDVAHGIARPAAPLTAYLAGLAAGLAGGTPAAAADAAARIRALIPE